MAIVLDAGHGGALARGGSTPNRAVGPAGTLEKQLTLDLARRAAASLASLGVEVRLTRDGDDNPTLRERALTGAGDVEAFVSLHFNAAGDPARQGGEVWIHAQAPPSCRALGESLRGALERATGHEARLFSAPLAVLDPRYHDPGVAACLVEICFLTDPAEEARLSDPDYRQQIAEALALALADRGGRVVARSEWFDVWHSVPLVQQLTGMSCWAAAAAMLVGWRECIDVDAEGVARGTGVWGAYRDGLLPGDVEMLARAWGLVAEPTHSLTIAELRRLLERFGPLWVGEASPGLHVIVVVGLYGDGTPDGTFVRVNDPWPVGRGQRYTISFRELAHNLDAAASLGAFGAQVLRTEGRDPLRWN
jgi:hypothetical protein